MDTLDIIKQLKQINKADKTQERIKALSDIFPADIVSVSIKKNKICITLSDGSVIESEEFAKVLSLDEVISLVKKYSTDITEDQIISLIKKHEFKLDPKNFIEVAKVVKDEVSKDMDSKLGNLENKIVEPKNTQAIRQDLEKLYSADGLDAKYIKNLPKLGDNKQMVKNSANKYFSKLVDVDRSNLTKVDGKYIIGNVVTSDLDTKADLVSGKVPASQLPSYVDDVVEYDTLDDFPATGETGKIYIATDTNITYRWGGSTYVEIGGPSGGETWGSITGTLSDQTDLQTALDSKADTDDIIWTKNGTTGYPTGISNIGIGLTTATEKLDVNGNVKVRGGLDFRYNANGDGISGTSAAGNQIMSITRQNGLSNASLGISAFGGIGLATAVKGGSPETTNFDLQITEAGDVGIGYTSIPTYKLDVNGDLRTQDTIFSEKPSNATAVFGDSDYLTKYIQIRQGANYANRWGLQANASISSAGVGLMVSTKPMAFKAGISGTDVFDTITDPHMLIDSDGTTRIKELQIDTATPSVIGQTWTATDTDGNGEWATSSGNKNVTTVSANYTALATDRVILVDTSTGDKIITLPTIGNLDSLGITIKKIDTSTNKITINSPNSETIDNLSSRDIDVYLQARTIITDGTNYWQI